MTSATLYSQLKSTRLSFTQRSECTFSIKDKVHSLLLQEQRFPARQGSTRAPQWTHGGVAFAPKPRSYRTTMNRKTRQLAMKSALSSKVAGGEFVCVDAITASEYKTKTMVNMLKAIGAEGKALVVLSEKNDMVVRSLANIPGVKTAYANTINVYDILNCDKLVMAKGAVEQITEVYA